MTKEEIAAIRQATIDFYVGAGCMVLGPDGEPLDVRAALVALSRPLRLEATDDQFVPWGGTMEQTMRKVLASKGITGPLADVILSKGAS